MQTRGVVFIHSCPQALVPHAEWAISSALRTPVRMQWITQPAGDGMQRAECQWSGPSGTANAIARALKSWPTLVYEVTEEPTAATDGERIAYVPERGYFRSQVSVNGDLSISENQLRHLRASARTVDDFRAGLDALLGQPFDDELEVYRQGGDNAPVTRIHRAG